MHFSCKSSSQIIDNRQAVLHVSAKVFTAYTNEVAYPVFLQRYAPVHLSLFSTYSVKLSIIFNLWKKKKILVFTSKGIIK